MLTSLTQSVCPAIPWSSSPKRDLHFIEIKPRYGAFIADYRSAGDLTTMNEIINFHNGHYRISLLKSIYRVCNQIEADIIRLAAGRRSTLTLFTPWRWLPKTMSTPYWLTTLNQFTWLWGGGLARIRGLMIFKRRASTSWTWSVPARRKRPSKITLIWSGRTTNFWVGKMIWN